MKSLYREVERMPCWNVEDAVDYTCSHRVNAHAVRTIQDQVYDIVGAQVWNSVMDQVLEQC